MSNWREQLLQVARDSQNVAISKSKFPLIFQNFNEEDVLAMVDVILSGQLTMSKKVAQFEKEFAEWVGAPYAVMVNSGSSANLLAVSVAMNPSRKSHLKPGDQVLIPAVCWSTSVWPVIQLGLVPVLVDVDAQTLNMDMGAFEKALNPKVKAVMAVHILGNMSDMNLLRRFCEANHLILIEDTCESLGSTFDGRTLGTIGDFGTYSFYYSHHMTTGEGGMVVCKTQEDVDLLKCLRAHGWTRELSNRVEIEKQNPNIDPRFLFVNIGYNLRPMEIQAALGLTQLKRLKRMNENRIQNHARIISALKEHPRWKGQFDFVKAQDKAQPVWFGMCLLLNEAYKNSKVDLLNYLTKAGVENRPIVSGNFVRQPAFDLFGFKQDPTQFPGAEKIHQNGFFIGIHAEKLEDAQVRELTDILLSFPFGQK